MPEMARLTTGFEIAEPPLSWTALRDDNSREEKLKWRRFLRGGPEMIEMAWGFG
jgi:hypothetical protein